MPALALDLGSSGEKMPPPLPNVWLLLPRRFIPKVPKAASK
jgi:hypothetical protein